MTSLVVVFSRATVHKSHRLTVIGNRLLRVSTPSGGTDPGGVQSKREQTVEYYRNTVYILCICHSDKLLSCFGQTSAASSFSMQLTKHI